MALVTLASILGKAVGAEYGVPAFNVNNLEFIQGVMQAAEELRSPVILAIAPRAIAHAGLEPLAALGLEHARRAAIPVVVHLDHGKDLETVRQSLALGFSSVMYDGSSLPLEENIRQTARAVEMARRTGASVEGEIGTMLTHGDRADAELTLERLRQFFTRPEEASQYIDATGVDALAVSVGTVHRMPIKTARIDRARLGDIHQAVSTPLVFHGCTGLEDPEYRAAYRLGVKKFNIGTQLMEAFTAGLAAAVRDGKNALGCLQAGREAVYEAAKGRIAVLNSGGKA
jgi:fructose-bisphosphate aldolase, class II